MKKFYKTAKILLVPSLWEEAWGRVVTEAHVSGIPVLASDRGGLPESVGPAGVIVKADAPIQKWVDGLSLLWDNFRVYNIYSEEAVQYSQRLEIQPASISAHLRNILQRVIASSR